MTLLRKTLRRLLKHYVIDLTMTSLPKTLRRWLKHYISDLTMASGLTAQNITSLAKTLRH